MPEEGLHLRSWAIVLFVALSSLDSLVALVSRRARVAAPSRSVGGAGRTSAELHVGPDVVGDAFVSKAGVPPPLSRVNAPRVSNYSAFECSGGSQRFDRVALKQIPLLPPISAAEYHLCLLRDVCLIDGAVTFYTDGEFEAAIPPEARAVDGFPALFDGFVRSLPAANPSNTRWRPAFVNAPRPRTLPFAPEDRLYILDELSYVENFGHLLVDNLLAAYGAADVLGVDVRSVQLVGTRSCLDAWNKKLVIAGVPVDAACSRNLGMWVPALFSYPYLEPPHTTNVCFRELVVGHAPAFALFSLFLQRASIIRRARSVIHTRLGVPPAPHLTAHSVLVLMKRAEYASIDLPNLCNDTRAWAHALTPAPRVECILPALLSLTEQLIAQSTASVLVAEVGSTGYGSLFARVGASFLSIVPKPAGNAKESQVFLFNNDVQTFYFAHSDLQEAGGKGPGALLLAIERAGVRLNLPDVALKSSL